MPMNEAAGYRRSYLTKEQKREAEAAIYGLSPKVMSPQTEPTYEEFLEWRAQHAAQGERQGIKEFDLNNPPRKPYAYQEYPKVVYSHERRISRVAHNVAEEHAALEAGWRNDPYPAELPVEVELDSAEADEVVRLDKIARRARQKRTE